MGIIPLTSLRRFFCLLPFSVLSAGCGGSDVPRPELVPVSGTVLYKGEPVEGATVVFRGEGSAKPAVDVTDSAGRFQLTSYEAGDGAVAGTHTVTVSKYESAAADTQDTSMEAAAARSTAAPPPAPKALIPQRYSAPLRSGLQQTVKSGEANDFQIELTD